MGSASHRNPRTCHAPQQAHGACANRKVLFQVKAGRGWDNIGGAVKTGKGCKASKRVKVKSKSVYRVVLIDSTNQATLAYSPRVTVKLK